MYLRSRPWRPSWISDRAILAFLSTSHPDASYLQVNWPFGSGEDAKIRFSRWQLSWITDRNCFSSFLSTSHPDASDQFLSQLAFRIRSTSKNNDFQDGDHGSQLGFSIGTNLPKFDLQVIPMIPTKFQLAYRFSR